MNPPLLIEGVAAATSSASLLLIADPLLLSPDLRSPDLLVSPSGVRRLFVSLRPGSFPLLWRPQALMSSESHLDALLTSSNTLSVFAAFAGVRFSLSLLLFSLG